MSQGPRSGSRKSRPNVLTILLDDVGFAQLSCFGSQIETPQLDRLAAGGLRYNRFHVTSICSSSRACLLTGRNHHAVGFGTVPRDSGPNTPPGYTARIPRSAATLPRLLRDNDYNTAAIGKWHLTPQREESAAGPFDRWPLALGFERFYGFMRGDTNQWTPNLVCDNHHVQPLKSPQEGYHLTEDLADTAIRYLLDQHHSAPERPFYLHFATGAMHTPHHVSKEWSDRYRGKFDGGWDRMREEIFRRQLDSGVVPPGTVLTPRPSWIRAWQELSIEERRLFARMHEVYAGFLTHADAQIGRVLSCLEKIGELDNTLIIATSDNGASGEGGPIGSFNEHRMGHRLPNSLEANLRHLEDWGGFKGCHHYSWGWAWAGNTPLRLWKRYTWLGGTRTPLIVHWPSGIRSRGEIRSQFAHIIDVMPTVLDACGIAPPEIVDGVTQQPIDGASIARTFDDPTASSPRSVQYFEIFGSRAIISGEWKATTDHVQGVQLDEIRLLEGSRSFKEDHWSLFNLQGDFSESNDLSERHPDVLRELEQLWYAEAGRNNVLPIMDGLSVPFLWQGKSPPHGPAWGVYFPGGSPISAAALPRLRGGGRISAVVDVPPAGAEGILCALGDWNSGYALYVLGGYLRFALNRAGELTLAVAEEPVKSGRVELGCTLRPEEEGGVQLTLDHDGRTVGRAHDPHPLPPDWQWQNGGSFLSIGKDRGFPVSDDYRPPFNWTGILHEVIFDVRPVGQDVAGELRAAISSD